MVSQSSASEDGLYKEHDRVTVLYNLTNQGTFIYVTYTY